MVGGGSWLYGAGWLLIVAFYFIMGLYSLTREETRVAIARMTELRVPYPSVAFWIGIALQFAGVALLAAGWHADIGVYLLIFVTFTASAIFHRFWTMQDAFRRTVSRRMLLHNMAIVGGLLLLLQNLR
ncbi:MAG: hypothetical protein A3I01_08490 [Betaproteobacteria bacterium RIFCSPLOWO2_02_FULL_65_24]|nr:MAG: hypothetical protein A3I01_08490 [Betaproteobacteria bacterium RIFCSPLOWO2_02_FULL_65_24]